MNEDPLRRRALRTSLGSARLRVRPPWRVPGIGNAKQNLSIIDISSPHCAMAPLSLFSVLFAIIRRSTPPATHPSYPSRDEKFAPPTKAAVIETEALGEQQKMATIHDWRWSIFFFFFRHGLVFGMRMDLDGVRTEYPPLHWEDGRAWNGRTAWAWRSLGLVAWHGAWDIGGVRDFCVGFFLLSSLLCCP